MANARGDSNSPPPTGGTRLYLVTPPRIFLPAFAEALKAALDGGDVAALQLRLKDTSDDDIRRAVETLLPIAQARAATFILNDRPDLAAATGCHGVHIGQEDAPYADARQAMGPDGVVGVTCHDSRDLAIAAAEQGADYVAFGAFFPTGTKTPKTRAGFDLIEWWAEITVVPCVAIGGITPENCAPLVKAGADFIAAVSAVWDHAQGPAAAVKAFNAAIKAST
ncbi:MAG: thiamine phosphate synthase [Rhodospirillales bacterium]|nr:thiamine phosphate synthase [Rhodospirillales bacterium]MSP79493.1 thiamine phosphate synthase [Rhodospirillales bacterium]